MLRRSVLAGAASVLLLTVVPLVAAGEAMSGTPMSETSLHAAAEKNDVAAIRKLLADGAQIDARDSTGTTALLMAVHGNRIDAARALIEAGADVNAKNNIEDSPYLYAGARGRLEILKMILAHGADLKSVNRYGGTALIPACERGHVETVRTLIAAGVDVDHVNKLHWTALLEAVILGDGGERHQQIVDLLVKAGADVNLADGKGVTPLQHARAGGYKQIEATLLAARAR
jgi:ankyrin repeat protein